MTECVGHAGFSDGLYKTDDFLRAQPFGNVPAAFSPDGGTRHIRIKQHYEGSSSAWGAQCREFMERTRTRRLGLMAILMRVLFSRGLLRFNY